MIDDGDRVVAVLPAEPRSAARARSLVLRACRRWKAERVCSDAELVVTELIANAVRHAGTDVTLSLTVLHGEHGAQEGVRAEVSDGSSQPVQPRQAGTFEENGRGLFLVDTLSSRWGADATNEGKTVWAELVPD